MAHHTHIISSSVRME